MTNPTPIVALLTDFGLSDHYVGVMKGEILKRCPTARMVDLTHQIAPQSIQHGSYCLEQSLGSFPPGTIFLCVVDPGVGSERRAIAVQADEFLFVAPDNGLLGRALDRLGALSRIVELETPAGSSFTFHGRDVFAPAAGRLAAGESLANLGTASEGFQRFPVVHPEVGDGFIDVSVLCADHFGNVVFELAKPDDDRYGDFLLGRTLSLGGRKIPFCQTFSQVDSGQSLFLWNSSSYLELAVRDGDAASLWGLKEGERVRLKP
jgi:S-adenosyl-L-methionine hydrolase (adenosine-forming)